MRKHSIGDARRPGRVRSVALVAAVCALAAGGGYTGALWAAGGDLDTVQIETGHLDVRILHGKARKPLVDRDRDGVTWFVTQDAGNSGASEIRDVELHKAVVPQQPSGGGAAATVSSGTSLNPAGADDVAWTRVDTRRPLVYPGETWVAAIPFTVKLEGHNLLADLRLEGSAARDKLRLAEAGFTVVEGVAGPAPIDPEQGTEASPTVPIDLSEPFTIELPAQTQTDDHARYTLLLTFRVPNRGPQHALDQGAQPSAGAELKPGVAGIDAEGLGSSEKSFDIRGLTTVIKDLDIVLEQTRSAEEG